ncbi:hypothetical protein FPOA_12673 [Fusarium poae]|uniref:Uncharacterized protein n=1 Tax=Fusarium poae TaxID=36050 RepID=A0A1B8A8E4_FUSPO|nr:hypothetical protein FPOA_12673 [Fusarium poae]
MATSLLSTAGKPGRPSKRGRADEETDRDEKRPRKKTTCFKDEDSVREQARKHRILTARMPTNALTSTWSLGRNRRLDTKHVRTLCTVFTQGGLNRKAEENHLLVLCSRADVSRMMKHLQRQGQSINPDISEELPFFDEWSSVNGGSQAEVMAGQHRIKALEAYVQETGAGEKELWWTCEFYDKDTLPLSLNLKLRVNRQDPAMADSHGQVWMQVVAASSQDPDLFCGKAAHVEDQMIDVLQLGSEKQFPTRRLATIWRNERWREMATRWCETSIGRATFKISTWDWMISYRIDDFWFGMFRSVLQTLSQLPGDAANEVELADWKRMSEFLGSTRTKDQVQTLFYPPSSSSSLSSSLSSSSSTATNRNTKRRPGFLTTTDDAGYEEIYSRILRTSRLRFTNIHRLLSLSREDGKVLFQVMNHVVAWLNATPTTISNQRDNNKPPLRADIVSTLNHCSDRYVHEAEKRLGVLVWEPDHHHYNSTPEAASILLQHEVLEFVLQRLGDFKSPSVKLYLEQAPRQVDSAQYTKRFEHETWNEVLTIVQRWVGHEFSSEWMKRPRNDHILPDQACSDNTTPSRPAHLVLTTSLGDCIRKDPELGADSASIVMEKLGNEAFEAVLSRWLTQHQRQRDPDAVAVCNEKAKGGVPEDAVPGPRTRTSPNLNEDQEIPPQEKAKKTGHHDDSGDPVTDCNSGPDSSESSPNLDLNYDKTTLSSSSLSLLQPKRSRDIEIIQIQPLVPPTTKPRTGTKQHHHHLGKPQRHSLPGARPSSSSSPGPQRRAGGSDRGTARAGAPTSSKQPGSGGDKRTPAASTMSSSSSSSRIAQNKPTWSRGVEAK